MQTIILSVFNVSVILIFWRVYSNLIGVIGYFIGWVIIKILK